MTNRLIILFFFSLLFKSIYSEYRTLNGTYNNLNNPFLAPALSRKNPPISHYSVDNNDIVIPTPGNYSSSVPLNYVNCSASNNLPEGLYPLPRCVSNIIGSVRTNENDVYNLDTLEKFKSKRKVSHMSTYWAFFLSIDLISGQYDGERYPTGIYIPQDDQLYLSNYFQSPNLAMNTVALEFQRSPLTSNGSGSNIVTPFLDGSQIYGFTTEQLSRVRDYGNRGRMLLISNNSTEDSKFGYPPKDINGEYVFGYTALKGRNVFTDIFYVIFLREHNRRCDQLWNIHRNAWSDEMYFQECRKWVIALMQRVAFYEYLGIVLGSPLPPYRGYNPNIEPNIDTFFATVTYRYGHSELSDYYNIVNENGDKLATLPLTYLQRPHLLETYGVPVIALSLALLRQEENDIYYADLIRKCTVQYPNPTTKQIVTEEIDIMSLDVIRNRDHAIPLYNDAREAMGLKRAAKWSDITSDTEAQRRLFETYSDINKVESIFGGLAEDHINGSNFGELFYKSFYDQWMAIRDSDRFWYESPDAGFTQNEIYEIDNTTLSHIIARNTPNTYKLPANIWIVQPSTSLKSYTEVSSLNSNKLDNNLPTDYPTSNHVSLSDNFDVYWKIVNDEIYFKLIMASTTSWFSIGFNDKDNMITSDMIIFRNIRENNVDNIEVKQYKSDGYYTPELVNDQSVRVRNVDVKSGVYSLVEISRPLSVKDGTLKPITKNNLISMIYAWNPSNNILTYHAGNKGSMKMDFFSDIKLSDIQTRQRKNLLSHGIAMFLVWAILYPFSIWRVRYKKTAGSYMKKHRNLQMLGLFITAMFGGVAIAISEEYISKTTHGIIGIILFCVIILQVGLGMFNFWNLINVESVNMGIIRLLRRIHFICGITLIILSWVNMYFGIKLYSELYLSNKVLVTLYLVWIGILVLIFIISENIFRIVDMRFQYFDPNTSDSKPKPKLRNFIEGYDLLPTLSFDEFNERVIRGMKLVIVENIIFDISKWMEYHPGGVKILERVIGTDITYDFFGSSSKLESSSDDDEEFDTLDQEKEIKKQPISDFIKERNNKGVNISDTVANFIDIININKTLGKKKLSRVSIHSHSKYATEKLATLAVARISNENKKGTITTSGTQQHYTSNYDQSPLPQVDPPNSSSSIFHRCIITNIEIVTNNYQSDSPIVKKFTLKPVHKDGHFPHRRFIPGDYIEIMCYIDQQRIVRQYSPLLQEFSEDYQEDNKDKMFWILVKIYKDGFMSKYLDKQLKNFEISIRGPLNLSESVLSNNQQLSIANCILLNPNKPNGCWDNLFMICGGTGITPMLQLIHHHLQSYNNVLQHRRYSQNSFNLHLLFANNSVSDIIHQKHLDYLVKKFQGNLTITYILVNPPNKWNSLKGHIDDIILFDWLANNINIITTSATTVTSADDVVPTQIVYYPQQRPYTGSSFDDYNIPKSAIATPQSLGQQQQPYSDPSSTSQSNTIDDLPDGSKIIVCGNNGFMFSIQNICNRIGIKEENLLFLV